VSLAEAVGGFAIVAALLTILPGLDSTLILRSALTQSKRHAYATALGIASGTFAWGAAAALGAAALLAASEIAFMILKIMGALYLAYLGVSMIAQTLRRKPIEREDAAAKPTGTLVAAFGRGAITNLLNPKVGVFYIALIPQFIPGGAPPLGMGLLLALVHVVESLIWFTAIIFAAHYAKRWLQSPRVSRWIDRVTGGMLVGFGAALLLESRS
jgi:threonine/homoserine/homoserine lactone efflux protein